MGRPEVGAAPHAGLARGGLTLSLDAATYEGTVAVLRDGAVVAEASAAMRGETEERLTPAVVRALAQAGATARDVARVVCGGGPGSFTSLRIAGSVAKGIALGSDVPLYAVSSLALVVAGVRDIAPGDYLAVLDAMRGESYAAPFRVHPGGRVAQSGEALLLPASAVAEAAARYGARPVGPGEELRAAPHARGVWRLRDELAAAAPVDLDAWEPWYGRMAEAQVRWEAAHGRALPVNGSFAVRSAVASDVDEMHAIEVASFPRPWRRNAFRELILGGNARVLVAERAGSMAGFVIVLAAADEAEIANLAVAPAGRRQGAGGALVAAALAEAARLGARRAFLEVRESNAAAQALYRRVGFDEVGRRHRYYDMPDEDAIVMRCNLPAALRGPACDAT
ncbi:MAG: tRNA (adenosine(37)-N6)-threonylcarbamoyltransferase complex dimerization subunit type 1 TsaB [Gemmatimonadaceae bacterium]|nr:tRNA (adenosine(37)-N6)-threonylcarbamoyltransferase complex dimerization subunit type 1 TsaB [Gemmatimonadaceae bacterium]